MSKDTRPNWEELYHSKDADCISLLRENKELSMSEESAQQYALATKKDIVELRKKLLRIFDIHDTVLTSTLDLHQAEKKLIVERNSKFMKEMQNIFATGTNSVDIQRKAKALITALGDDNE